VNWNRAVKWLARVALVAFFIASATRLADGSDVRWRDLLVPLGWCMVVAALVYFSLGGHE